MKSCGILKMQVLFEHIRTFAQKMRTMREHLAQADKLSLQIPEGKLVFGRSGNVLRSRYLPGT